MNTATTDAIDGYVQNGMNTVDGWGLDRFLADLFIALDAEQKERGITGNLFEVGVHHGRVAILLALLQRSDETVVAMDLFEAQEQNIDRSGYGSSSEFARNMAQWAPGRNVETIAANSLAYDFLRSSGLRAGVRFAHIDGAHYVDAVLNDLLKTERVMVDGGIMILDDIWHSGFPGVCEAACRYLITRPAFVPFALGHNKLMLAKPAYAPFYLERTRRTIPSTIGKAVEFFGSPVVSLDF